jgi:acylphosphatase
VSGGPVREAFVFVGRVQGVGFRATAAAIAVDLDLEGWVRNEPDGTVRCEVQGPQASIETFLSRLRGRMSENLRSMSREPRAIEAGLGRFDVRRGPLGR